MPTSVADEVGDRGDALLTALDHVRDLRLARARTEREQAKMLAEYEEVRRTLTALLAEIDGGDNGHRE